MSICAEQVSVACDGDDSVRNPMRLLDLITHLDRMANKSVLTPFVKTMGKPRYAQVKFESNWCMGQDKSKEQYFHEFSAVSCPAAVTMTEVAVQQRKFNVVLLVTEEGGSENATLSANIHFTVQELLNLLMDRMNVNPNALIATAREKHKAQMLQLVPEYGVSHLAFVPIMGRLFRDTGLNPMNKVKRLCRALKTASWKVQHGVMTQNPSCSDDALNSYLNAVVDRIKTLMTDDYYGEILPWAESLHLYWNGARWCHWDMLMHKYGSVLRTKMTEWGWAALQRELSSRFSWHSGSTPVILHAPTFEVIAELFDTKKNTRLENASNAQNCQTTTPVTEPTPQQQQQPPTDEVTLPLPDRIVFWRNQCDFWHAVLDGDTNAVRHMMSIPPCPDSADPSTADNWALQMAFSLKHDAIRDMLLADERVLKVLLRPKPRITVVHV